jgi:hypothetical protein
MKTSKFCRMENHTWIEEYYGYTCKKCGMFIPMGVGGWKPVDEAGDLGEYDYWWNEDEYEYWGDYED